MSLSAFKHTPKGTKIGSILSDPAVIRGMIEKSRHDRPAVEAVGTRIAAAVGNLAHDERKYVGRWIKELLASQGLVPDRKGRVAEGNLFARGTIYRTLGRIAPARSAAERVAAARAILRATPEPIMSSEDLIAGRRREARRQG